MSLTSNYPPTSRVGYVLKRYPRYSETFIVNEILAHEAVGQEIEIFALRPVEETHFQDQLGKVRAPVTRLRDRFSGPEPFWQRLSAACEEQPAALNVLSKLDGIVSGQDVAQALDLAVEVRQRGVTHLHAHFGTVATSVARLAAAMAGIGYSFTAHAKDIYHEYSAPQHLDLKFRDADMAVTVSDYNLKYLRDTFAAPRAVRVYNGLDLERFSWTPPKAHAAEILAVGRLVEKKGFHFLIEALRIMRSEGRDVTCRIVGAGDEEDHLRAQIAESDLADYIQLEGPRPQAEVIELMRNAAVLACPCVVGSDGNRDGLPTVLLEAMAIGLPVISTDVVGIPELVRNRDTGLLVPEGDADALATALVEVIGDPDLRQDLSQRARALIERDFDITKSAGALRAIFAKSIERRNRKQVA
ncbi:glycosyltransferase [Tateyamaria sp. ANG-S1]|uniref:glycosyltransferase n=1 Tax=Tateyamaria sp. ANG-S1 TaxID=1577905 RepID=UPI00057F5F95|nr:glycosyltransferase [Tateyamaria sp. ANG-S1]KIC47832.1 glycosyl transferase family 1 [Tateyamaria sp. ANG-S1]